MFMNGLWEAREVGGCRRRATCLDLVLLLQQSFRLIYPHLKNAFSRFPHQNTYNSL